jgi:hypothetical protein
MADDAKLALAGTELDAVPPLLQGGFQIEVETGKSVRELLTSQWGIPDEVIESRISTVFLDGKPVDDLDRATVHDGSTLALSGAMPGLVGATMRRGGVIAGFRSGITHRESGAPGHAGKGTIRVKVFNLLIAELMPLFLARGILVAADRLPKTLRGRLTARDAAGRVRLFAPRPTDSPKGAGPAPRPGA